MDIQNHFYGHAAVLARWAGLARPRHIPGLLQHGWTASSPLGAHFGDFPTVERSGARSLFVWSHEARGWDPRATPRPTVAIGAPFAYLDLMAPPSREPATGTLLIPLHGTRVVEVRGDHETLARYYSETEGATTVCLHVEDVSRPEVVRAWQAHGHQVVSAGGRMDPDFLGRILHLLRTHQRVVSNRLQTAVVYAAAIGRDIGVHGDPMAIGGVVSLEQIYHRWPELHGEVVDPRAAQDVARAELGWGAALKPEALRAALGWDRRHPGPMIDYWALAPLRKTVNVLGLGTRADGSTQSAQGVRATSFLRHPLSHLPSRLPRALPAVEPLPQPLRVR